MFEGLIQVIDIQTIFVFVCVLLLIWLYRETRLPENFPPGPRPWPIIGNLGLFASNPLKGHVCLTELSKEYGQVVGLKMGVYKAILLNGVEATKEALVKNSEAYSARPEYLSVFTRINSINGKRLGILWTDGHIWKESRRFALTTLRDFGLGKRSLEERIQEEAAAMCAEISKHAEQPYDLSTLAQEATSNIICSLCFGSRFDYANPQFQRLMRLLRQNVSTPGFLALFNFIPVLKFLPDPPFLKRMLRNISHFFDFFREQIELHRPSYDPNQPRDFIDLYLTQEEKEKSEKKEDQIFTRDQMTFIIGDLYAAGTETSSTTIRWLVLYMLHYPEVQRRCQAEIDRVIGSSRQPSLADRANMPYVDATIHETQRLGNIAPMGLPHSTSEDTKLYQYNIPKDTLVLINLYAIHMDPRHWENPEEFRPERWLDADGKLKKMESFLPFSTGSRVCLGESLAKNELFLFITTLLQRFDFEPEDPNNLPSIEGVLGLSLAPVNFRVIAKSR